MTRDQRQFILELYSEVSAYAMRAAFIFRYLERVASEIAELGKGIRDVEKNSTLSQIL